MLHAAHDGFDGSTEIVSVREAGLRDFSSQSASQCRLVETQAGEQLTAFIAGEVEVVQGQAVLVGSASITPFE